ncbi:MAG: histidine phosphatase family protein [Lentisphaerae bacterium]|nr:histidine phosphatase family protein [Lentisphaerota bacterium]
MKRRHPHPLVPGHAAGDVTVVLVRHGQALAEDGSPLGPPLSRLGRRQARYVARRLQPQRFTRIMASDLARASETAAFIRAHHPHTPFSFDPRLREVQMDHHGHAPIPRQPALLTRLKAERRRVAACCRALAREAMPGDQVLVVAHGNLIRLAVALLCRTDPRQSFFFRTYNTSVTILTFKAGGRSDHKLILADCVRHLPADCITNWAASERTRP